MKKILLLASVAVSGSSVLADLPAQTVSLNQIVQQALANNLIVAKGELDIKNAEENLTSTFSTEWLPAFQGQLTAGKTYTRTKPQTPSMTENTAYTAGISANFNIYKGGASAAAVSAAKIGVLNAKTERAKASSDTIFDVISASIDVYVSRELVSLSKSDVEFYAKQFEQQQVYFDVGEKTRADVDSMEVELKKAQSKLVEKEAILRKAETNYILLTGTKAPEGLAIDELPVLPATLNEAIEKGLKYGLDVKLADYAAASASENTNIAIGKAGPSLDLSTSYGRNLGSSLPGSATTPYPTTNTFTNTGSISLTLTVPLDVFGANASGIRSTKYNEASARVDAVQARRKLASQITNSFLTLQEKIANVPTAKAQVKAAQSAFDVVQEEYNVGTKAYIDMIKAQQNLMEAKTDLLETKTDKVKAAYNLLKEMGLLSQDLFDLAPTTKSQETVAAWSWSIPDNEVPIHGDAPIDLLREDAGKLIISEDTEETESEEFSNTGEGSPETPSENVADLAPNGADEAQADAPEEPAKNIEKTE